MSLKNKINIYGTTLKQCFNTSKPLITGYKRNNLCEYSQDDYGAHNICVFLTPEFLKFTRSQNNNLTGLKPENKWCICVGRWIEAYKYAVENKDFSIVPCIYGEATDFSVLKSVKFDILKPFLLDWTRRTLI